MTPEASHTPSDAGMGSRELQPVETGLSFTELAESNFGNWIAGLTEDLDNKSADTREQLTILHEEMPSLIMRALRAGAAEQRDKKMESSAKTTDPTGYWREFGWKGTQQAVLGGSLRAASGVLNEYHTILQDQQRKIHERILIHDEATNTMFPEPFSEEEDAKLDKIAKEKGRIYAVTDALHMQFKIESPFVNIVTEKFFGRISASLEVEEQPVEVPTDDEFRDFFERNKKNAA